MSQTQIQASANRNPLPTGAQIYDALMAQIEPDLLTKNIPLLDEKHKGETPEQHAQRTARYQKAMAEYDKRYAELMASLNRDVAQQKRTGIAAIEQKNAKKEASTLSGIESAILSSS